MRLIDKWGPDEQSISQIQTVLVTWILFIWSSDNPGRFGVIGLSDRCLLVKLPAARRHLREVAKARRPICLVGILLDIIYFNANVLHTKKSNTLHFASSLFAHSKPLRTRTRNSEQQTTGAHFCETSREIRNKSKIHVFNPTFCSSCRATPF